MLRTFDDIYETMPWDAVDAVVFDVGQVLLSYNPQEILDEHVPDRPDLHPFLLEKIFRSPYWLMRDHGLMTRDEAIILMVESNLQRSVILPSEKAFSYKMRLEAMNRQGQRTDLTSTPVVEKLSGKEALSVTRIGNDSGESREQVRRYIRLTELIPELLDLVDEGRIAFRPAVELSYLQKEEQGALLEQIAYADATPSLAQAIKLKRFSQDGKLNNEVIESIMSEEKPNQREKINIKYAEARRFIPASVPYEKTGEYILKALEYYHRYQERQKSRNDAR